MKNCHEIAKELPEFKNKKLFMDFWEDSKKFRHFRTIIDTDIDQFEIIVEKMKMDCREASYGSLKYGVEKVEEVLKMLLPPSGNVINTLKEIST